MFFMHHWDLKPFPLIFCSYFEGKMLALLILKLMPLGHVSSFIVLDSVFEFFICIKENKHCKKWSKKETKMNYCMAMWCHTWTWSSFQPYVGRNIKSVISSKWNKLFLNFGQVFNTVFPIIQTNNYDWVFVSFKIYYNCKYPWLQEVSFTCITFIVFNMDKMQRVESNMYLYTYV